MLIALIGSRKLASELFEFICKNSKSHNYVVVGGVAPNFDNWWNDNLNEIFLKYKIPIYSTFSELLSNVKPDIVFSVNYWKVIPESDLMKVPSIINIHHSYKLRFRGRYSTSWAIMRARIDNYFWHGTSIHLIEKNLDSGPIILTEKCKIYTNDTAASLFSRVEELAAKLFKNNFKYLLDGDYKFAKPDKKYFYYNKNSFLTMPEKECYQKEDFYDFVRAWSFPGRPTPTLVINGNKIEFNLLDL